MILMTRTNLLDVVPLFADSAIPLLSQVRLLIESFHTRLSLLSFCFEVMGSCFSLMGPLFSLKCLFVGDISFMMRLFFNTFGFFCKEFHVFFKLRVLSVVLFLITVSRGNLRSQICIIIKMSIATATATAVAATIAARMPCLVFLYVSDRLMMDLLMSDWLMIDGLVSDWLMSNWLMIDLLVSNWLMLNLLVSDWLMMDLLVSDWLMLDLLVFDWFMMDLLMSDWLMCDSPIINSRLVEGFFLFDHELRPLNRLRLCRSWSSSCLRLRNYMLDMLLYGRATGCRY